MPLFYSTSLTTKVGFNTQPMHLMYQNSDVVCYQFAQKLIFLSYEVLRFQFIPKLRFYHVEGAFYIASAELNGLRLEKQHVELFYIGHLFAFLRAFFFSFIGSTSFDFSIKSPKSSSGSASSFERGLASFSFSHLSPVSDHL